MLFKNKHHIALSIAIVALIFVTSLPIFAQDDNILVVARAVDATGLDPHTQTAFTSLALLNIIYEPLVITDRELNVQPGLATDWEFSADGMTLTMSLREGVKFHDGSDFTAEDVIASFERLLDEETASAARTNYQSIATMEAPDDFTVVFNLSLPDAPLLAAMATTNAAIMPAELARDGDPATTVIGTGPFALAERVPDERTLLRANTDWWGEGPFLDGVEIRIIPDETSILAALRAGTIDFAVLNDPLAATLLVDDPEIILHRTPDLSYNVLQLRAAVEPLDKIEVRQAISCAIDRQEIVDSAALGEGQVTGPLTQASFALPTSELFCYQRDIARARELMAAAGLEEGFTLTVMAANAEPPVALSIAQIIQEQLADINITVEIESLELGVYVDRWLAADFGAAVALNGGRIDPFTMYARYWQTDAQFSEVAGYIDDTLDSLMELGRVETDPTERFQIFADFQNHLAEVVPWVWLYNGFTYTAHQPNIVGWEPMANNSLYFLSSARIEG